MIGAALAAASLALAPVGERAFPRAWNGASLNGLSGLTRVADDAYYAVRDSGGALFALTIGVDRATGMPTNCVVTGQTALAGRGDLECVAWDRARRWVWVGDEDDGSIRAFDPATGAERARAAVPAVFDAFRYNRSFEALDVDDGPRATRAHGTRVRLQRFTRPAPEAAWTAAGQWMYVTDSVGGGDFAGKSRCGVSGLLCLGDGTLLVLEREMSIKKGKVLPSFRCRIYAIDFNHADDVADVVALKETARRPVAKRRLFGAHTGLAMYEGICLGPALADGSRSVLLISDGDDGAANRILAFRLVPAVTR